MPRQDDSSDRTRKRATVEHEAASPYPNDGLAALLGGVAAIASGKSMMDAPTTTTIVDAAPIAATPSRFDVLIPNLLEKLGVYVGAKYFLVLMSLVRPSLRDIVVDQLNFKQRSALLRFWFLQPPSLPIPAHVQSILAQEWNVPCSIMVAWWQSPPHVHSPAALITIMGVSPNLWLSTTLLQSWL